jgi:hypothetical protein
MERRHWPCFRKSAPASRGIMRKVIFFTILYVVGWMVFFALQPMKAHSQPLPMQVTPNTNNLMRVIPKTDTLGPGGSAGPMQFSSSSNCVPEPHSEHRIWKCGDSAPIAFGEPQVYCRTEGRLTICERE